MRRLIFPLAAALVLALPASGSAATISVKIISGTFAPAQVTVNAGDTVSWTNNTNNNHQIVSDDANFVSPVLKAGQTYSYTFKAAAKYAYHDSLHPTIKGSVTVTGPPPAVTLAADTAVVTYGGSTTISGKISSGDSAEPVSITSRTTGSSSAQQVATVNTATGGTFSYSVKPTIQTTYTATWKNATSQSVTILVRPKVSLLRYGRTKLWAKIATGESLAGHYVILQRLTGFGWVTVSRLTLGASSGRIFKAPHVRGYRTYRVYLTASQAGNGYLEAFSNKARVYFRR